MEYLLSGVQALNPTPYTLNPKSAWDEGGRVDSKLFGVIVSGGSMNVAQLLMPRTVHDLHTIAQQFPGIRVFRVKF